MLEIVGVLVVFALIVFDWWFFRVIADWFYPDKGKLREAIRYVFTPDIISLFRGRFMKDQCAEFGLGLMIVVYILIIVLEVAFVNNVFF